MELNRLSKFGRHQLKDWLTKEEVLKRTGATRTQLLLWHREIFAFSSKPLFRRPGRGRGTITLYDPVCISIIRRVLEMKEMWRRNFHIWRWHLWLEGYPVSIREDCVRIIEERQKELLPQKGQDALDVAEIMIECLGNPKRGSLAERVYNRIGDGSNLFSLFSWIVHVLLGEKPLPDWNDLVDAEEPLDLIWVPEKHQDPTIGDLARDAIGVSPEWAQATPPRKRMSIEAVQRALSGATGDDWEQAREDWRALDDVVVIWERVHVIHKLMKQGVKEGSVSGEEAHQNLQVLQKMTKAIPMRMVTRLYGDTLTRAMLLGFLMQIRRSSMNGNVDKVMATLREFTVTIRRATDGRFQPA